MLVVGDKIHMLVRNVKVNSLTGWQVVVTLLIDSSSTTDPECSVLLIEEADTAATCVEIGASFVRRGRDHSYPCP